MKRRKFLKSTSAVVSYALLPGGLLSCNNSRNKKADQLFYVGTYTSRGGKGIYCCNLDVVKGNMTLENVKGKVADPSFLAVHPGGSFLYTVNEVAEFEGETGGGVSSFQIDKNSGELYFLNHRVSGGIHPCYITISRNGRFILAGNYSSGNFSVLPVDADGSLLPAIELIQHEGSGADPKRQKSAHVHSLIFNRDNTLLLVADLGIDKIMVYPFNEDDGRVDKSSSFSLPSDPGAGPRHMVFSPDEKFLYCINELNSTISVYSFDKDGDNKQAIQVISTLPSGFGDPNTGADIHLHPGGDFLYASNRGHDSIAVYSRNNKTGLLNLQQITSSGGKNPRNFAIDPTGSFLLTANQSSNNIVLFKIVKESGLLQPTGGVLEIPAPVCIKFM